MTVSCVSPHFLTPRDTGLTHVMGQTGPRPPPYLLTPDIRHYHVWDGSEKWGEVQWLLFLVGPERIQLIMKTTFAEIFGLSWWKWIKFTDDWVSGIMLESPDYSICWTWAEWIEEEEEGPNRMFLTYREWSDGQRRKLMKEMSQRYETLCYQGHQILVACDVKWMTSVIKKMDRTFQFRENLHLNVRVK